MEQDLQSWDPVPYPIVPSAVEYSSADTAITRHFKCVHGQSHNAAGELFLAAWVLVSSRMADTKCAVFGLASPSSMGTTAVLAKVETEQSIAEYLLHIRKQVDYARSHHKAEESSTTPLKTAKQEFHTVLSLSSTQNQPHSLHGQQPWRNQHALVLEVQTIEEGYTVSANYDSRVLDSWSMNNLFNRIEFVLGQIAIAGPSTRVGEINIITPEDLEQIWDWNTSVHSPITRSVHSLVEETVKSHPDSPAVCAWDGELNYGELDRLATRLAHHLQTLGVGPEVIVPLLCDKSVWTTVAVLGTMKAGGAFMLLEPMLPEQRLKGVVKMVGSKLILTSASCQDLSSRLAEHSMTVDSELFTKLDDEELPAAELPDVSPTSAAYVIFTSGSTGIPKGVVITHQNLASALTYLAPRLRNDLGTRVYDFISYSFGLAIVNLFSVLLAGTCLCVPRSADRKLNFPGSFASLKSNTIWMTPSIADAIPPRAVPGLRLIGFGGEPVRPRDVTKWDGQAVVIPGYGASECVTVATLNTTYKTPDEASRIGTGAGTVLWVVDPENHDILLPPGCVGELVIEGPTVGRGYLNDPQKTAGVFINDPAWLVQGSPNHPGRTGRTYKTGDLVHYHEDGGLTYVGRKDVQVKIRGQRVELGEVEHWVTTYMPEATSVVAEVFTPKGKNASPALAMFLTMPEDKDKAVSSDPAGAALLKVPHHVVDKLLENLPSYMVPTVFFSVQQMPKTPTGKINRRALREMGSAFTHQELAMMQTAGKGEKRSPSTPIERQIQIVWSQILDLPLEAIGLDDSFLELGGDSVTAIKVVAEVRKAGIELAVASLIRHTNTLCDLAVEAELTKGTMENVAAFSLLSPEIDASSVLKEISDEYQYPQTAIQDAYPCTPLQEGLMALTLKKPGDYMMQAPLQLDSSVDVEKFCRAVADVVQTTQVLRTRIIQHNKLGLLQVVLNESLQWSKATSLSAYLDADRATPVDLGDRLTRYAIIEEDTTGSKWFVMTAHHSLYDGWFMPRLAEQIHRAYNGDQFIQQPQMSVFIKYLQNQDQSVLDKYWREELGDCESVPFPPTSHSAQLHAPDKALERRLSRPKKQAQLATESSIIRAAWALVAGHMTSSDDVVFGVTVSGRSASIPGIDNLAGPTIATVPLRIKFNNSSKVSDYLSSVHQQATDMIPFEQAGLQHISSISPSTQEACRFQTLLVVQPQDNGKVKNELGTWSFDDRDQLDNSYPLTIDANLGEDSILMKATYSSKAIEPWIVEGLLNRFERVLNQLGSANPDQLLSDINLLSEDDLSQVWSWNDTVPAKAEQCLHTLFEQQAQSRPEAPALCAWDGELTYSELERLSANLAHHLISAGVKQETVVPLCFEKSLWTTVGMLGVLRAGAAFVLLDPTLPEQRLTGIVEDISATLILSSEKNKDLSKRLHSNVVVVNSETLENLSRSGVNLSLPTVSPESLMYVVFTSGSTGTPKGVMITHSNLASALRHQGDVLGYSTDSRVYDFASYSFDPCIEHVFFTLGTGGCLCVPQAQDSRDRLGESIAALRANKIEITPSVSLVLDPLTVPGLEKMIFGGEAVRAQHAAPWLEKNVQVINTYGPCECTPTSTINRSGSTPEKAVAIGTGAGVVTWVVDARDHNRLLPPGSVGELLLEGPLVGNGYLNDPEKTAESFVNDPTWLIRGPSGDKSGRRGRLYKTGDLVQYGEDGCLTFIGRKNSNQIKVRGQRVEIGEIEHALTSHGAVEDAAVVLCQTTGREPQLAGFVTLRSGVLPEGPKDSSGNSPLKERIAQELSNNLRLTLPHYMVPQTITVLDVMPSNQSGKVDRRALAQASPSSQLARRPVKQPVSDTERILQQAWADVLAIDAAAISLDDNFFQLGGNSIDAMKVVGEARKAHLKVSVADIFLHPELADLSSTVSRLIETSSEIIAPFALLGDIVDVPTLRNQLSKQYGFDPSGIEDVYPCTPLQEGLLSLSYKSPGDYAMQAPLEFFPDIDIAKFRSAWEEAVRALPVLRTRIVQHNTLGLLQAVLHEPINWVEFDSLEKYLEADGNLPMSLGQPLVRLGLIKDGSDLGKHKYFVLTMHHALYDGWSQPLIINAVNQAYKGVVIKPSTQFQSFIKYIKETETTSSANYWKNSLAGCDFEPFPALPSSITQPKADSLVHHSFKLPQGQSTSITSSTVLRAAWGLLVGRTTSEEDVVFGVTLSGRNAPVAGIEQMVAPTFATVPVRIKLDNDLTASEYLSRVQRQATEMIPYEQTGLPQISKLSADAELACRFQSILVIQPQGGTVVGDEVLGRWKTKENFYQHFNPYAIMLELELEEDYGVSVHASYDSRIISQWNMENLLKRFEFTINQLLGVDSTDTPLSKIEIATPQDLNHLWDWNKTLPSTVDRCVHHIVKEMADSQPDATAVCARDGNLTYGELESYASSLASQLVEIGLRQDQFVPLFFEKSVWTPVAMLAVLKAGGAFVAFDTSLPEQRLKTIVEQTNATVVLSSKSNVDFASRVSSLPVIELSLQSITKKSSVVFEQSKQQSSSSAMFIVFTSGSTGTPKGAVHTHSNLASALQHQASILGLSKSSRIFDFASYAFDLSVHNAFIAFMTGGCLCIPSDDDRRENVGKSMREMEVTLANITPSVARLVNPTEVPSLEVILLAGEVFSVDDAARWWDHCRVINAYGPAECIVSTLKLDAKSPEECLSIGNGTGLVTWVVDPNDPNRLLPPGCIGELLLEGPLVCRGYLNDPEKTKAAFIRAPEWLHQNTRRDGIYGRIYKTGDLVHYNPNGSLTFVGRKDTQVKIRGQRVEPGEVEHHVKKCIPEAGLTVVEAIIPVGGTKENAYLAAFVEVNDIAEGAVRVIPLTPELEDSLGRSLPTHMIPSVFYYMKTLPTTTTGKTNRRQLRETAASKSLQQLSETFSKRQPTSTMEWKLQMIWAQILRIDPSTIGLDDTFFQLGGDSIAAMKVSAEARNQGIDLTVADIFRHRRLDKVADQAKETSAKNEGILPVDRTTNAVEQSSAQKRLWFMEQLHPGMTWFLMRRALRVHGPLDVKALNSALNALQSRHETLRTTFVTKDEQQLQVVHDFQPRSLPVIEVSSGPDLQQAVEKDHSTVFNLEIEPGWRVTVYRLSKDHHVISTVMHHIITDGWSLDVLQKELAIFYSAALRGEDPLSKVEDLPVQYRDYSVWENQQHQSDEHQRQLDYWVGQLEMSRPAEFLCDKKRPETLSGDAMAVEFKIEGNLYEKLQQFCQVHDVTPFIVLLAAYRATHYRLTNQGDAIIGTVNANRDRWELKNLVGFFVNMQCYRSTVEDESFAQLVNQIQATSIAAFANQDVPFEKIVAKLQRGRDVSRNPLIQVSFAYHSLSLDQLDQKGLEGLEAESINQATTSSIDVEAHFFEGEKAFRGEFLFSTDLFSAETAKNTVTVFERVLDQSLLKPDTAISSLPLLTHDDFTTLRSMGLVDIERTEYGRNSSLIDIFREQVALTPLNIAVKDSVSQISFAELDKLSDRVARWLTRRSLPAESLVSVFAARECQAIIAFIGILKANLAYLPLDPEAPASRIKMYIEATTGPHFMLTGKDMIAPSLNLDDMRAVSISSILDDSQSQEGTDLDPLLNLRGPTASSLAYVMFTSGTTGKPKGIMIQHRGIARMMRHSNLWGRLRPGGATGLISSPAFDLGTPDIYIALLNGGTVVCIDKMTVLNPTALAKVFADEKIRATSWTPALLRPTLAEVPRIFQDLDFIIVAGDKADPEDMAMVKKNTRGFVFNAYGPTENTACSTMYSFGENDVCPNGAPIGRAISNTACHVMDAQLQLVPLGTIGELVLTGDGLARGYLDPKMDVNRFVSVNIGGEKNVRAYRTGDYVRYRPSDGQLEYFGRIDGQIKIRGHRIELGEIEGFLVRHESVKEAAAVLHKQERREPEIAVFVTLAQGVHNPDPEAVREQLYKQARVNLPTYMVPQSITILKQMPVNTNGKIDRQKLAQMKPTQTAAASASIEQPTSETGRQLQRIWAKVLNVERSTIGLHDSFFTIGGSSISAMQVVSMVRTAGLNLDLAGLFRHATLEALANYIDLKASEVPAIQELVDTPLIEPSTKKLLLAEINSSKSSLCAEDVEDIFPVTSFQQATLEALTTGPTVATYYNYFYLDFGLDLNIPRLEKAFNTILENYPILRSSFLYLKEDFWQVVPHQLRVQLQVEDVAGDLEQAFNDVCLNDAGKAMATEPPIGCFILKEQGRGARVVVRLSHAQYDGLSLPTIFQSLVDGYNGKPLPKAQRFSRFLLHASQRRDASIAYWTQVLQGSSPVTIETIRPKLLASHKIPQGAPATEIAVEASVSLPSIVNNITEATVARTAWAVVLSRLLGVDDITYGYLVSGRNVLLEDTPQVLGPCVNLVPLRATLSPSDTAAELLQSIQDQFLSIGEADSLGYRDIIKTCTQWQGKRNFDVWMLHQNVEEHPEFSISSTKKSPLGFYEYSNRVMPSIYLSSSLHGNHLHFKILSNSHILSRGSAKSMVDELCTVAARLADCSDVTIKQLMEKEI